MFFMLILRIPEHLVQGSMNALRKRIAETTPEESQTMIDRISRVRDRWGGKKN
jgi:hypothetical protein